MPGRGDRFSDAPIDDMSRLICEARAAIQLLLDRPFVFFGHSLGALVCFELARELRRCGLPLPGRIFVAGRAAPQLPKRGPKFHQLADKELVQLLIRLGGFPDQILNCPELITLLLPTIRADLLLHENYDYVQERPLDRPITALGGIDDTELTPGALEAWGFQTSSHFEMRTFDGGHFFVHTHQKAIISLIVESLSTRSGCSRGLGF